MEIIEFAKQILSCETLRDKLWIPSSLESAVRSPSGDAPDYPTRAPNLQPGRTRRKKIKNSLLTGHNLQDQNARIQLLHAFANHELLALELFAWSLLKFPDTPPSFKKGIAGIMLDEQRHCTLYCKRLEDLGASFGDLPLNDFMWRSITQATTIAQFTAAMSLTFEQANLDFAAHYAKAFAAAGDQASADILQLVFDEEIGHVKHGVHWFEQWSPYDADLFDQHESSLPFPLTLSRAQGHPFHDEARLKAGFSRDYINRLKTFSSSKGRPPRIFFFNPNYELENTTSSNNFSASKTVQLLEQDLSSLMMFLAHKDDIVLVPKKPSDQFLLGLKQDGFTHCEWIDLQNAKHNIAKSFRHRKHIANLEPWGWSPRSHAVLNPLLPFLTLPQQHRIAALNRDHKKADRPEWIGKNYAAHIRTQSPWTLDVLSQNVLTIRQIDDLDTNLLRIRAMNISPSRWVAKAPLGASGNQQLRFDRDQELSDNHLGWMRNTITQQGCLLLEPWVKKYADLSVVGEVTHEGATKIWGITRFITDEKGHYTGHLLASPLTNLDNVVTRAAHNAYDDGSGHKNYVDRLNASAQFVGHALAENGYTGPFGIDAFLYDSSVWTPSRPISLQPLVEINTRWTMGHIAHQLHRKTAARGPATWHHLMRPALLHKGFSNFKDFAAQMKSSHQERFIVTNDPSLAEQCLTYILIL